MHPAMQAATQPYTQAPQPYQQVRVKSEPPADRQLLLLLLNVLFVGSLIMFLRNDLRCQLSSGSFSPSTHAKRLSASTM